MLELRDRLTGKERAIQITAAASLLVDAADRVALPIGERIARHLKLSGIGDRVRLVNECGQPAQMLERLEDARRRGAPGF